MIADHRRASLQPRNRAEVQRRRQNNEFNRMEMPNGGFVPNEQAPPASTTGEQSTAAAAVPGSEPAPKRRPGRPKGSTKKNLAGEGPVARVKRPVGRPRKDGFPAGSVGPPRPRPKPATVGELI